jgi:hypothetical protein
MSSREWARRSTTTGTGQPPTAAAEKKAERKQKESRKKAERKQKESRKKAERKQKEGVRVCYTVKYV